MNHDDAMPSRVRYTYQTTPEVRLQTAHGIWGGINSQGEIEMNFYHESDRLPEFTEQYIAPDGSLGHEMTPMQGEEHEVIRLIHSRVLVNYQTARSILEWLEDRVSALEEDERHDIYDPNSGIEQ